MAVKKEKIVKKKKVKLEEAPRIIKDSVFPVMVIVQGSGLSVNHLYGRFKNRTFLKPEGKLFKNQSVISICEQLGFDYSIDEKTKEITIKHGIKEQKYSVEYKVFGRWLTKSSSTLKSDVSNRLKLCEDSLADALGVDDRHFWKTTVEKIHDPENERFEIIVNILE